MTVSAGRENLCTNPVVFGSKDGTTLVAGVLLVPRLIPEVIPGCDMTDATVVVA